MYKTKTDTNQSSSSQSGGDAQVDHSKSTHEVDGGKKKTTTTTTSTHARNKSIINPYARPHVNLAEGDKAHSKSEDEGLIISPNAVFEDDDDHSETFLCLVRRLLLTSTKKSKDGQRHNIFQTRCKINQDVFNVIIDGGSSENIISRDIVTRLKLTPKKHLKPYKIGWIKVVGAEDLGNMDLNVVHKGKENTYTRSK
nr:hypothetical protein [Tanacetum cinerariifolium]